MKLKFSCEMKKGHCLERRFLIVIKVIYPKDYKHRLYTLASTIDYRCLAFFDPETYILNPTLTFFSLLCKSTF